MNNYRFSIIIPVFNAENFLEQCVESILNQTFVNYEIILVDDGSNDNSYNICLKYAEKNENIKLIHKTNEGQLLTRLRGVDESIGEYLCFVDSDDYIRDDALEILDQIIKKSSAELICFRWRRTDMFGTPQLPEKDDPFSKSGIVSKELFMEKVLATQCFNSLCTKVFKKSCFNMNDNFSRYSKIKNGEDLLQSISVFEKANIIYYLKEELYFYRTNESSISHIINFDHVSSVGIVRPALYELVERMGMLDDKKKELFFDNYLSIIWSTTQIISRIKLNNKEYLNQINGLYKQKYVQMARQYVRKTKMKSYMKIGLWLFYSKKYNLLKLYTLLITKLRNTINKDKLR